MLRTRPNSFMAVAALVTDTWHAWEPENLGTIAGPWQITGAATHVWTVDRGCDCDLSNLACSLVLPWPRR